MSDTKTPGSRTLRTGTLYRTAALDRAAVDGEKRTVALSFSSEEPAERWFGVEILDHSPGAVRLDRMKRGGPLLMDHTREDQVGVVEDISIGSDRKGHAVARFGRSGRAEEVFRDVQDGIRTNVSVGYIPHAMTLVETQDDVGTYRVTDWEPLEISIVSVPMDTSVGIGRGQDGDHEALIVAPEQADTPKEDPMPETVIDVQKERAAAADGERSRVAEILTVSEKFPQFAELAKKAVADGTPADVFKGKVLEALGAVAVAATPEIGMSATEIKDYRIVRAINAMADGTWYRENSLEREASEAAAKTYRKAPQGFFIPWDVQTARRDMETGGASYGGRVIATNLLAASFIEMLRNKQITLAMGARTLGGLVGNVAIPGQSSGATSYWIATENTAITSESAAVFKQVALTPHTVGAFTDIGRQLIKQASIDVEMFVRDDLTTTCAIAADLAAINGADGSGEPCGILQSGLTTVPIDTNGGVPTFKKIVALWKAVAKANALAGAMGFCTNSSAYAQLMVTEKATNTAQFVAKEEFDAQGFGRILGYKCGISEQVPADLTKSGGSSLSALIFGNWADLIIAQWGTVDVVVDTATGATAGTVRVVAFQDIDIGIRNVASFAAIVDLATTDVA